MDTNCRRLLALQNFSEAENDDRMHRKIVCQIPRRVLSYRGPCIDARNKQPDQSILVLMNRYIKNFRSTDHHAKRKVVPSEKFLPISDIVDGIDRYHFF